MHFETLSVHAGNAVDPGTGAIRRPLVMANSYALPADPSELSWSDFSTPLYTRNGGANQAWLEEKLALLETAGRRGDVDAVALASGAPTLADGSEGTAGSLSGYVTVWVVCGVTALLAAASLVVVPRLAFSDGTEAGLREVAPATGEERA